LLSLNVRHDELTAQFPTTLPPQAVTFAQDNPPPVPPLEVPPVPVPAAPLEVPPVPVPVPPPELPPVPELFRLVLHAPEIIANATAIARNADWTFIEGSPLK
jgi:hypothetical protein